MILRVVTPEYFSSIGDYLAELMISEVLTASTLSTLTNRLIYKGLASFPIPKVAIDAVVDYEVIWRRSQSQSIDPEARDVMFLLLHNKLPVLERLFRIGVRQDPYCPHCPGAEIADLEHVFCTCSRTSLCWSWVRLKILGVCQQGLHSSNWELLNLVLPQNHCEQGIIWLISSYVSYVWKNLLVGDSAVKVEKFFGFLSFKYKNSKFEFGRFFGIQ